ncbi:uncharacterized protein LOC126993142 [Eriocheir sinensis]|uniref:uncharacterized protein LOC126993142 n=1 Tax=Eriocheir sinensis TaxID=95602 RepID=UPI0021CA9AA9|nr:uncharacterized protein LOC126993142 [Eriocheir sinensis]
MPEVVSQHKLVDRPPGIPGYRPAVWCAVCGYKATHNTSTVCVEEHCPNHCHTACLSGAPEYNCGNTGQLRAEAGILHPVTYIEQTPATSATNTDPEIVEDSVLDTLSREQLKQIASPASAHRPGQQARALGDGQGSQGEVEGEVPLPEPRATTSPLGEAVSHNQSLTSATQSATTSSDAIPSVPSLTSTGSQAQPSLAPPGHGTESGNGRQPTQRRKIQTTAAGRGTSSPPTSNRQRGDANSQEVEGPREETRCPKCRRKGHTRLQCPRNLVCSHCQGPYHTAQTCRVRREEERQEALLTAVRQSNQETLAALRGGWQHPQVNQSPQNPLTLHSHSLLPLKPSYHIQPPLNFLPHHPPQPLHLSQHQSYPYPRPQSYPQTQHHPLPQTNPQTQHVPLQLQQNNFPHSPVFLGQQNAYYEQFSGAQAA